MTDLVTKRLSFRLWQESDFEIFVQYFTDEKTARFVGGVKTPEEAWRLMAAYIGHYHLRGYSHLAVTEKSSGRLVGCAGLWNSRPWPELELGYWMLPAMQGKGYATEAAQRIKDYAAYDLHASTLVSYIDPQNQPSINVAKKINGIKEKDINLLSFGKHQVFRYFSQ